MKKSKTLLQLSTAIAALAFVFAGSAVAGGKIHLHSAGAKSRLKSHVTAKASFYGEDTIATTIVNESDYQVYVKYVDIDGFHAFDTLPPGYDEDIDFDIDDGSHRITILADDDYIPEFGTVIFDEWVKNGGIKYVENDDSDDTYDFGDFSFGTSLKGKHQTNKSAAKKLRVSVK